MRHVCLLRAVNVAGQNLIQSTALRAVFAGLGYGGVASYLQSGNVLFDAPRGDHASAIETALAAVGVDTVAILRSHRQLARVAAGNPWPDAGPKQVYVLFLRDRTRRKLLADPPAAPGEQLVVAGDVVYARHPAGVGKTKLSAAWIEKQLGTPATRRNWNTLTKLIELSAG